MLLLLPLLGMLQIRFHVIPYVATFRKKLKPYLYTKAIPTLISTAAWHSPPILGHLFIYLFGVLRRFQHCTGHITTGSWKGRGNLYTQFIRVLYCKLPTNGKQLPAFPLETMPGTEARPQRWEARVLPLCHHDPLLGH